MKEARHARGGGPPVSNGAFDGIFDDGDLSVASQMITSERDVLYVSGSRVEGFGNPCSDVDFFVVLDEQYAVLQQPALREHHYVDCEYHTWDELASLATTINQVPLNDAIDSVIDDEQLGLYYRTAIGVPLVNSERFLEMQQYFSKERFATVFALVNARRAQAALRNARGMRAYGDELGLLFNARMAAEFSIESLLASRGEAYPGRKWRFEKTARVFGRESAMYARVWSLQNVGLRSVGAYLDEVESFCTDCGIFAARGTGWLRVKRNQEVREVELRNGCVLVLGDRAHRVRGWSVTLWRELDGAGLSQLAALLVDEFCVPEEDRWHIAAQFVDTMVERGLAHVEWPPNDSGGGGAYARTAPQ